MALLEIEGLTKHFGAHRGLDAVSVTVERAGALAILGPSGSGKSTCLRCINRLELFETGTIRLDGERISDRTVDVNRTRREIGMVFQSFNLYPHLTALGNVTLGPRKLLGKSRQDAEELGREMLASVGLTDKAPQYPSQLSGGQQQRVAIARALAMSPKIMLFDEPTSALDPELVGEVLSAIRALRERGMTMLIVTHEVSFAREVADEAVIFDHGRIIERGRAGEVLRQPKEPRTREFLARVIGHAV
ncbi:MAG: amino acid ABC transporter ATP-binding protein [Burkholderiales bacterium]